MNEARSLEIGSEFAGYEILGLAGRGGMGVVYRVRNVILDKERALKVVSPELSSDVAFTTRFRRESRIAASIDHPNVIPIYHAGEQDGLVYVVMEYVDGADLAGLLEQCEQLPSTRCLEIMSQVASALDAAHERGLVHRDVKPANVLISGRDGGEHAYLTDFGLAKRVLSDSHLTQTGVFVGTYRYAAPEQFNDAPVDRRADVYALGCLLFHALSGHPPFERDSVEALIAAHLFVEPPRLSGVLVNSSQELDDVIQVALAKNPADRYASAGELIAAARRALVPLSAVRARDEAQTRLKMPTTAKPSSSREGGHIEGAAIGGVDSLEGTRRADSGGIPATRRVGVPRSRAVLAAAFVLIGAAVALFGLGVFDGGHDVAGVNLGVRPVLPQDLRPSSLADRALKGYPECRFKTPGTFAKLTTFKATCNGSVTELVEVDLRGPTTVRQTVAAYSRRPKLDTLRCQALKAPLTVCMAGDRRIALSSLSHTRSTALAHYRALVDTVRAASG